MTQRVIACAFCRHYRKEGRCDAFPRGIPDIVQSGRVTHRRPLVGDHGIRWEPLEGFEDALDDIPLDQEPFSPAQMEGR